MLCAMAMGGAGRGLACPVAMGGAGALGMTRMGMGVAPWAHVGAEDGARGGTAIKLHCTSSVTHERPWIGMGG